MKNEKDNKKRKMFSIKWRFGLIFSLFLTVSFTFLFFVFNWIINKQASIELENRALTVARSLVATGSTHILGHKMDMYNKLVGDFFQLDPEIAYILTRLPNKQLLLHNLPEGLPNALFDELSPESIKTPVFSRITTKKRGVRDVAVSLLGAKGSIRVGISDLRIKQSIHKNQTILAIIMFLSMLLGTFFSILFSQRLTMPLIYLADAANRVSSGHMDVPVLKVKYNDEIKVLADAFERMRESFLIAMRRLRR